MHEEKKNILGYTYKIYNSGYNTEMINKQCNAGDPLETPGGLYRGPPSMKNVNTVIDDVHVKQVQCSITMVSSIYSSAFTWSHSTAAETDRVTTMERHVRKIA